jgi:hypothetical protein
MYPNKNRGRIHAIHVCNKIFFFSIISSDIQTIIQKYYKINVRIVEIKDGIK